LFITIRGEEREEKGERRGEKHFGFAMSDLFLRLSAL